MNILYGVSGEGLGHAFHAIEITKFLQKKGHKVIIVTYGQSYDILKNKFDVFLIEGIHPIYGGGILNLKKSFVYNIKPILKNFKRKKEIQDKVKKFNPDVCISDMEPIVPIISYYYKVPLIFLSNQTRFIRFKLDFPKKYFKNYFIAKIAIKLVVPKADYYIALSISNLKSKKKNTFISSPIIRKEVICSKPNNKGRIVVYLSKKNQRILDILKNIDEKFIVYGYDTNKIDNNFEFKKKENFIGDFIKSKAIISNSGFTSVSESLYLKKPYLAVPLKGQFEQEFNSLFLEKKGFGIYSKFLTEKDIKDFLLHLNKYEKNLKNYNLNLENVFLVLEKILEKIKIK